MEIERKFLVETVPSLDGVIGVRIQQGYLPVRGEHDQMRVRRQDDVCLFTVKRGVGVAREEVEVEIAPELFEKLWPLTDGRRISKVRYAISLRDDLVELDRYEDELDGLWVAEVEFSSLSAAEAFQPPSWLGEEVTGDQRYSNVTLASKGLSS